MTSKQKTILVVDDEQDILEFLQKLLEMKGYAVAITSLSGIIASKITRPPHFVTLR